MNWFPGFYFVVFTCHPLKLQLISMFFDNWSQIIKMLLTGTLAYVAIVVILVILLYRLLNDQSIIKQIYNIAGYTYGPLLGLFSFGIFTKFTVKDIFVPVVAISSPIICYFISKNSAILFNGYKFGFELLILNGLITFLGLLIISKIKKTNTL